MQHCSIKERKKQGGGIGRSRDRSELPLGPAMPADPPGGGSGGEMAKPGETRRNEEK